MSLLHLLSRQARRWRGDKCAAAGVEFALTAPAMLMMMALIVFAGEGFEIQRKVTMTMRTLTDLVTQQCDVGPTAPAYATPCPSNTYTYTQIINAACLVMAPYVQSASPCSDPNLNFTIAEIQTSPASQIWCKAYNTSNCPGSTFPSNLSTSPNLIYGNVQYIYNPLGLWFQSANITFSDSFYMLPRINTTVACTGC
jgi:Flp pilus assembly protein TadG